VPDKETAELMKIFYTQLLAGNSIEKLLPLQKPNAKKILALLLGCVCFS
jgi:hypothetical protein